MPTPHPTSAAPYRAPFGAPSLAAVLPVMFALLAAFTYGWRSMDHAPEPTALTSAPDAPSATGFSAAAGMATLTHLLQEQAPHPVGSPLHAVVRDRILTILRDAGYEPKVDPTLQCTPRYGCAWVQNIVAIRRGADSTRAVMVSAHYDSVPAGPGASDDGAGTAIVLELARALARGPQPKNDIVLLISDGEELGLFGAHAFLARDPAMRRIPVMVNLEARGTSGPSVMFETGDGNAHLMRIYGQAVRRPVANSLAFEIYKRLPNGTDFTVYRDHGVIGFNLAFIAKASRYHTPLDDLAHLDQATLQHHGDNAFALTSALAAADLAELQTTADSSYFDVFGRVLVQWPSLWNLPAAAVALLLLIVLVVLRRRELGGGLRTFVWSLLALLAPLILLGGLGTALAYPLGHWPGALLIDHPMPWFGRAALLLAALLVALVLGIAAGRRRSAAAVTAAVWLGMTALAALLSFAVPGASYPLLLPCVGFVVVAFALLLGDVPNAMCWASIIGFLLIAFFWTGLSVMFESALGFPQGMEKLLALTPLTWAALAVFAHSSTPSPRRPTPAVLLPLLLVSAGLAATAAAATTVPAATVHRPRGLSFLYQDDGTAAGPRWLAYSIPPEQPAVLDAAGFGREPESFYRLGAVASTGRARPAADLRLPPPTFAPATIEPAAPAGGPRVLRGTLRLPPGALAGGFTIGPNSGLLALRIEGQQVWSEERLAGGAARSLRLPGLAGRDVHLELTLAPGAKGPFLVYARLPLPDGSSELGTLRSHRPADTTPFDFGDCAVVIRRIPL